MRIIAGSARGIRLEPPLGNDVRPTPDRVRESLFNIIAPRLERSTFLDLFAGTGANGIEALSRGAMQADFIDSDPRSIALIEKNLERTRLSGQATLVRGALPACLTRLTGPGRKQGYTLIFADPPHAFTKFPEILEAIAGLGLLHADGLLVLEHSANVDLGKLPEGLHLIRESRYGKTRLSFFEGTSSESGSKTS